MKQIHVRRYVYVLVLHTHLLVLHTYLPTYLHLLAFLKFMPRITVSENFFKYVYICTTIMKSPVGHYGTPTYPRFVADPSSNPVTKLQRNTKHLG